MLYSMKMNLVTHWAGHYLIVQLEGVDSKFGLLITLQIDITGLILDVVPDIQYSIPDVGRDNFIINH